MKEAMAMKKQWRNLSSVVEGIIAGTDLELVDVDYVRDWYLRVYLDKPIGVEFGWLSVGERKNWSAVLDEKRSQLRKIVEVSSPSLDRVLKKDKDLIRYNGRDVDIQLFKPVCMAVNTGALQGFTDTTIWALLLMVKAWHFERSAYCTNSITSWF